MWDSIIKPTLVLTVVCAVIAGSLAFVNDMTESIISQRMLEEQQQSRKQALGEAERFEEIEIEGVPGEIMGIYQGDRKSVV